MLGKMLTDHLKDIFVENLLSVKRYLTILLSLEKQHSVFFYNFPKLVNWEAYSIFRNGTSFYQTAAKLQAREVLNSF